MTETLLVDAQFLDQWKFRGHSYGECMTHHYLDLMYVYIPKNASTWTKDKLSKHKWDNANYHHDNLNKKPVVILRDPIERWLSGMAEYLTRFHPTIKLDSEETLDVLFYKVIFDDHTERQVNFLHGLDAFKCIFFWCDEDYRNKFSEFISDIHGQNTFNSEPYKQVSNDSFERRYFKQTLANALNTKTVYKTKLEQHYAQDYILIEKIQKLIL